MNRIINIALIIFIINRVISTIPTCVNISSPTKDVLTINSTPQVIPPILFLEERRAIWFSTARCHLKWFDYLLDYDHFKHMKNFIVGFEDILPIDQSRNFKLKNDEKTTYAISQDDNDIFYYIEYEADFKRYTDEIIAAVIWVYKKSNNDLPDNANMTVENLECLKRFKLSSLANQQVGLTATGMPKKNKKVYTSFLTYKRWVQKQMVIEMINKFDYDKTKEVNESEETDDSDYDDEKNDINYYDDNDDDDNDNENDDVNYNDINIKNNANVDEKNIIDKITTKNIDNISISNIDNYYENISASTSASPSPSPTFNTSIIIEILTNNITTNNSISTFNSNINRSLLVIKESKISIIAHYLDDLWYYICSGFLVCGSFIVGAITAYRHWRLRKSCFKRRLENEYTYIDDSRYRASHPQSIYSDLSFKSDMYEPMTPPRNKPLIVHQPYYANTLSLYDQPQSGRPRSWYDRPKSGILRPITIFKSRR